MPNIIEYINIGNTDYTIVDTTAEHTANKATSFQESPTNTRYPSEKLVKDNLDLKLNKSAVVTTFPASPTNATVPSAKLVKDTIDNLNLAGKVDQSHILSAFQSTPSDSYVASEKLTKTSLDSKVAKTDIAVGFSGSPSNSKVTSEKLVYDTLQLLQTDIEDDISAVGDLKVDKTSVVTSFSVTTSDENVPSEKLVADSLDEKEDVSNKVSAFQATPDNVHYPTEKLVADSLSLLADDVATKVVDELPSVSEANPNADYVTENGLFYKVIDGEWKMIGGAKAEVVAELPLSGDEYTDYYVENTDDVYLHYRWMDEYTIPAEEEGEEDTVVEGHFYSVGSDAYSKSEIDALLTGIRTAHSTDVASIESEIASANRSIGVNAAAIEVLQNREKSYSLNLAQEDTDYYVQLLEAIGEGDGTVTSQFKLPATGGGGGGQSATTTLTVTRVTPSPLTVTPTDRIVIQANITSVDDEQDTVDCAYTLKLGSAIIMSGECLQGLNSFDVTDHCTIGTQKFVLTVTDTGGSVNVKQWTVQLVDVRLLSSFSDRVTYTANQTVNFTYTPYGAVPKTVHFKLDGTNLASVVTSASGILQSYTLPAQEHGAHLLECWITATVNNTEIETDHIFKDIIWYDEESDVPVIGCIYRYDYYGVADAKQYSAFSIPYVVYDPRTISPNVNLMVDGDLVNELNLSSATNAWSYKSDVSGIHVLRISCRDTVVMVRVNVEELEYDIEPVSASLDFDFNPVGMSNTSVNRLWVDSEHPEVRMTVSNNFDWNNGGYQTDENGDTYFCVKSGTRAYFSHNLFGRDPKTTGAEFKIIFRSTNVSDKDAVFLTCLSNAENDNVGLEMRVHEAYVYDSSDTLQTSYSEEDIIEFEYNINSIDLEDDSATSFVMTYEDGVAARPMLYANDAGLLLHQLNPVPITVGSDDCDIHIYRMKSYASALSDSEILSNFIADARSAEVMLERYERNRIYDENNHLTPDSVSEACPDLKVIMISCPYFTNDKSNYVKYTNVECRHKNGDPILDNWTFTNGYHAGQGTTSNRYGLAGRNIDIIFGFDGENQVVSKIPLESDYISAVTFKDGTRYEGKNAKIALTRTSEPNTWFNIKVNIASSENANNALLQKRYNDYIPYKTPAQKRNPKLKNDMEFVNCVVFIKETDPDISTHREFADNEWHFYAIGNIGDSKKTDNTRVNDPEDMSEFVVEISDNTLPNAYFDTGVYYTEGGGITYDESESVVNFNLDIPSRIVYPITQAQWENENNSKRIALYDDWDGSFEFRYDMSTKDGETIESAAILAQQAISKQVFRDMYEFIVTSSDADFVNHFEDWFIVESPLYWYLFTERYTMIDNRSKNTFWHYGKTYITEAEALEMGDDAVNYTIDDVAAGINNGYRFDIWCYDTDSALGIDNNGELNLVYGKEDIDYKTDGVPSSGYVFNAADSVFWRRIRQLFSSRLRSMYLSRESMNCWSATSLINEFDAWQNQFPEELWRLDIERKYLRPYYDGNTVAGIPKNPDFLQNMMNGRKKYQRRQFERNQEIYIGTKYFGTNQCADSRAISFRCNTPQDAVVRPNYTLRVTPYSDMYLTVVYGNTTPQAVRAKGGTEYTFTTNMTVMDDTQILIHCAENIQAINDLSACYIRANNFSAASKLKTLIIGSNVSGYSNPFITTLSIKDNALLEYLDIRNCPNLSGSLNFSGCPKLLTFYAEGSAISGVTFARNGKIQVAHLPETIASLSMIRLNDLIDLTLAGTSRFISLICEYCGYDPKALLETAINTLQTVSILGIDWTFYNTTVLNKVLAMYSSQLSGTVTITGQIRASEIDAYESAWTDLELIYDDSQLVPQRTVTYVNLDGTVLYTYLCDLNGTTIDPVMEGLIEAPTMEPDAQYIYTYSGWTGLGTVTTNTTVTAAYSTRVRTYTVRWYEHPGDSVLYSKEVAYGAEAVFGGTMPTSETYTGTYRLFKGWDKNTGYVMGDMDVYAKWTNDGLPSSGAALETLTPTQICALCETSDGVNSEFSARYSLKDYFDVQLGLDYDFDDVESEVLLENQYFDGTNYVNKNVNLFGPDAPSFTLAIDFELQGNSGSNILASCYNSATSEGFYLSGAGDPYINWMDSSVTTARLCAQGRRNMIVIRHQAGSSTLYVYSSKCGSGSSGGNYYSETVGSFALRNPSGIAPTNTNGITFGAIPTVSGGTTRYVSYGKGWIHWSKIWYGDLGATACSELAAFPREKIRMEYVGFGRQRLTNDNFAYAGASFIANNLTSMYLPVNTSGDTSSWEGTNLQRYLNEKLFKAFPYEWQAAIKRVRVKTYASGTGSIVNTSEDYLYIPSAGEVTYSNSYQQEFDGVTQSGTAGGLISFYQNSSSTSTLSWRIKFPGIAIEDRGTIPGKTHYYGAEDPYYNGASLETGDTWYYGGIARVYLSQADSAKHDYYGVIELSGETNRSAAGGYWIPASYWCTRSYERGYTNKIGLSNGGGLWYGSTVYYPACIAFSI